MCEITHFQSGFFINRTNTLCIGHHKHHDVTKEMPLLASCTDNFDDEVKLIRDRYIRTGFPYAFINDVIENFKFSRFDHIIPENFFNDKVDKPNFRIRLLFCHRNECLSLLSYRFR